jgi:hypothetical protein
MNSSILAGIGLPRIKTNLLFSDAEGRREVDTLIPLISEAYGH